MLVAHNIVPLSQRESKKAWGSLPIRHAVDAAPPTGNEYRSHTAGPKETRNRYTASMHDYHKRQAFIGTARNAENHMNLLPFLNRFLGRGRYSNCSRPENRRDLPHGELAERAHSTALNLTRIIS
jgi:hypothetical protein